MAYNSLNLKQTGWFYHAPAKRKNAAPVGYPPPSQIPGLNGMMEEPVEENQKGHWIKDTDSDYVVLAKQGGRPDLLRMRTPKPRSDQAKGYPRCEWFYLEDNAIEDAQKAPANQQQEKYDFLLPDYMVHHVRENPGQGEPTTDLHPDHKDSAFQGYIPSRAPFHYDQHSAFDRDDNPTDKTRRLPESRQMGYGVRSEKLRDKSVEYTTPLPERGCAPQSEYQGFEKQYIPVFNPDESNPTDMSKTLAFGYKTDWEDQKNQWDKKQEKFAESHKDRSSRQNMTSEYQYGFKQTPLTSGNRRASSLLGKLQNETSHTENAPFKLTRFKNVPSRVDSRRNPPVRS